jgi:hypothetical protein
MMGQHKPLTVTIGIILIPDKVLPPCEEQCASVQDCSSVLKLTQTSMLHAARRFDLSMHRKQTLCLIPSWAKITHSTNLTQLGRGPLLQSEARPVLFPQHRRRVRICLLNRLDDRLPPLLYTHASLTWPFRCAEILYELDIWIINGPSLVGIAKIPWWNEVWQILAPTNLSASIPILCGSRSIS